MKRRLLIGLAAVLCSGLCACSQNSAPSQTDATVITTEAATEVTTMKQASGKTEIRELNVDYNGRQVYGKAYIADTGRQTPLVILSHGLGANHQRVADYARDLHENGYSAYIFDFPNGSSPYLENKSGTETTKMSVMTEADVLEAVYAEAKTWDFVDTSRIYLLGESQGGLVSAVVAVNHPGEFSGLLLLYPAFNIPDEVHKAYSTLEEVPEEYDLLDWITVGRIYAEDVWNMNIYDDLQNYNGRTLIIHGDSDPVVNVSYSETADELMPDCELYILSGAGHGFSGSDYGTAMETILEFLNET